MIHTSKLYYSIIQLVIVSYSILSSPLSIEAQLNISPPIVLHTLESKLSKKGFNNVIAFKKDNLLVVSYENRIFKYETKVICNILKEVVTTQFEISKVVLVPTFNNIPIVTIKLNTNDYLKIRRNQLPYGDVKSFLSIEREIWDDIRIIKKRRTESYFFDIVIHPQLKVDIGGFTEFASLQFNIAPEANISLWKGMNLSAQIILPIYNGFKTNNSRIRPGLISINQIFRFPHNTFLSTTFGLFSHERYGIHLASRKIFLNGSLSLGTDFGFTGEARNRENNITTKKINYLTALVNAKYFINKYDLWLHLTYGKFLHNEVGGQIELLRQFRNVDLGLFVIKFQNETNAGFRFAIPLYTSKSFKTKSLKIRLPKEFNWEYWYYGLKADENGYLFKTRIRSDQSIDKLMRQYNSSIIKS